MAITDPIADMLTRIRNGSKARFSKVDIPCSSVKVEIARVLKDEGYIKNYKVTADDKQGVLRVYLKYSASQAPALKSIVRVSKPGRRVYVGRDAVKPVLNGLGTAIITTSSGVMSDKDARRKNVGGELVCKVW